MAGSLAVGFDLGDSVDLGLGFAVGVVFGHTQCRSSRRLRVVPSTAPSVTDTKDR